MSTIASPITFEEMERLSDDKLYELVDGQLVEKHNVAMLSIWIAGQILHLLKSQLESQGLGWALSALGLNCFDWLENHGRRPDVCYLSRESWPQGVVDAPVTVAPALCVEVLSPNENAYELDAKVEEYLRAGVKLVWVVQPESRTVLVIRADGSTARLRGDQRIENEPALPGFKATVADFFPKKPV